MEDSIGRKDFLHLMRFSIWNSLIYTAILKKKKKKYLLTSMAILKKKKKKKKLVDIYSYR
jgi:predicted nucleotide-binding protein (sugar kinase/HSP70/actin superfamily)